MWNMETPISLHTAHLNSLGMDISWDVECHLAGTSNALELEAPQAPDFDGHLLLYEGLAGCKRLIPYQAGPSFPTYRTTNIYTYSQMRVPTLNPEGYICLGVRALTQNPESHLSSRPKQHTGKECLQATSGIAARRFIRTSSNAGGTAWCVSSSWAEAACQQ